MKKNVGFIGYWEEAGGYSTRGNVRVCDYGRRQPTPKVRNPEIKVQAPFLLLFTVFNECYFSQYSKFRLTYTLHSSYKLALSLEQVNLNFNRFTPLEHVAITTRYYEMHTIQCDVMPYGVLIIE